MDDFTVDERDRINLLYANDFKDATPNDFKLIRRWEAENAKREAEHSAKMELLQNESDEKLRIATQQALYAMETLDELKEAALARLKAVE